MSRQIIKTIITEIDWKRATWTIKWRIALIRNTWTHRPIKISSAIFNTIDIGGISAEGVLVGTSKKIYWGGVICLINFGYSWVTYMKIDSNTPKANEGMGIYFDTLS